MILLTGATGYLGTLVLARLLEDPDDGPQIICPVRAADAAGARARLDATLAQIWREPGIARSKRVQAVAADLTGDLELDQVGEITHVLHCAAAVEFDLPLEQARAVNVEGTRRILDLVRQAPQLERIVHVSTAYVAGRAEGDVLEDVPVSGQIFRNSYEQSKHEAEALIWEQADSMPIVVCRPSIVVGEAQTGWTSSFNVLYPPLRAYSRGILRAAPATADGIVDVVTGDYVADALIELLDAPAASGTYHVVAGEDALSVAELRDLAAATFGREPVELVSQDGPADGVFAPYFRVHCRFDDRRAQELLGAAGITRPSIRDAFPRLMEFADDAAWGKRRIARDEVINSSQPC